MKEIELLELEIKLMQDCIKRVREFKDDNKSYNPYSSLIVGELRHRAVAMKQRLTRINKISTRKIFD